MDIFGKKKTNKTIPYPGTQQLLNGISAVIACEKEYTEAACFYQNTAANHFGSAWNQEKNNEFINFNQHGLISIQTENLGSAAAASSGLASSGVRCSLFNCPSQNISSITESLYAAAGKRLPYVVSMSSHTVSKSGHNTQCSHDDYHSLEKTGLIQLFAFDVQSVADFTVIGRKIAELSLTPVIVAQDYNYTSASIQTVALPEPAMLAKYLGQANDLIEPPTPAQKHLFGKLRRRIPETWNIDQPLQTGANLDQDSYMSSVAGQRPYFYEHIEEISTQCLDEWEQLTGRTYQRVQQYACEKADYLIVVQGSTYDLAKQTIDSLNQNTKQKTGILCITFFRPFPGDLISQLIKNKQGVTILERTDQPLAEGLPIITEIRSAISKAWENAHDKDNHPNYAQFTKITDAPKLYSGCYGLGGKDLTANDIKACVENMQTEKQAKNFYYLGINFSQKDALSPQQEIQQQDLLIAYPDIDRLSLPAALNAAPVSKQTISIQIHASNKIELENLRQDISQVYWKQFKLHIKSTPIQTKGKNNHVACTVSFATKKPINHKPAGQIDTILISTLEVLAFANPLLDLKQNGHCIIQLQKQSQSHQLDQIPAYIQSYIIKNQIPLHCFELETTDQDKINLAFKLGLFQQTIMSEVTHLTEEEAFKRLDSRPDVIASTLAAIKQTAIDETGNSTSLTTDWEDPEAPAAFQRHPSNPNQIASLNQFWIRSGYQYHLNKNTEHQADPFISLGVVPAASGLMGNLNSLRTQHPVWNPENCTACGACYSACPDSAIPGLVNTVNEVFECNIKRIEKNGHKVRFLRRAIRTVEKKYHELTNDKSVGTNLDPIIAKSIGDTIKEYPEHERDDVKQEFDWFKEVMGDFKFALTETYHEEMNNRMPRNGGLFSITINPDSCKGCMECIKVCEPGALETVEQTTESLETLNNKWNYWQDLPTSNKKFSLIDDLNNKQGVLQSLLLDKANYNSTIHSDHSKAGSGEKTALRIFTATVSALMQPRVEQHVKKIKQLITELEKHIRLQLAESLDVSDNDAIISAIDENKNVDLTLSRLTGSIDKYKATQPIDPEWLRWALNIVNDLKQLQALYTSGIEGEKRAAMGLVQGNDLLAEWQTEFPYNPFPFPWASHLSHDAPALAMGLFEGQMLKMAKGFKAIRIAELEIKGKYKKAEHDQLFNQFNWEQFSEEEYLMCPPIVVVNSEGLNLYAGLQSLSQSLASQLPLKVLILDNQITDLKQPYAKQMTLLGIAHKNTFVQQGSISNLPHLIEGMIDGLNYQGPALWSVYSASQPETGYANNSLIKQSQLAVESRAYPLIVFDPRQGPQWENCLNININQDLDQDWISYPLNYTDEYGNQFSKDLPLSYADWALSVQHYQPHFQMAQAEDEDKLCLITEYILLSEPERQEQLPFIWAAQPETNHLIKLVVSNELVKATERSRDFWHTIKALSGKNRVEVDTQAIADQARSDMAQSITEGLMEMMNGNNSIIASLLTEVPKSATQATIPGKKPDIEKPKTAEKKPAPKPVASKSQEKPAKEEKKPEKATAHEPVWIETPDCTTCDECVEIAPNIFQYNEDKKAIVVDPTKGTYEQIVKSAEKCTAVIIHPGTPWNPEEPNLDKLIKRAEKYQ